ncbi:hypothetical protein C8R48DRAFT_674150 [Suillus tomentosus]|nr:hypothetical protein C8R48DRAFT_674150 [Suillus tomentosus]
MTWAVASVTDERPTVNDLRATMVKHSVEAKAPGNDPGQVKVNKLIGFSEKEGILAMREDTAISIILSSTCQPQQARAGAFYASQGITNRQKNGRHILRLLASNDDFPDYAITEAMSTNLRKDPGIIESEKIEEAHPLVAGLRKTLEIAEHTNVMIGENGNTIKRKKSIRHDGAEIPLGVTPIAPVSESLVAIHPVMQPRIQRRHELEGHDHAAIINLSLMATNVVRGTKDQLHTFARKGDDSMEFNAVDLMIPIIQGLEDQNTIDEQILPHTLIVPMATQALPTPSESRWSHSRTIVRDSTTIHDVEPPNLGVDDSTSLESFPTNPLSHTLRTEDLVGDGGESDGSADGAVAGATAAGGEYDQSEENSALVLDVTLTQMQQ